MMFEGFARQWTPLLPTRSITTRPQRIRLAGQNLVVWRPDSNLPPTVLFDRCPHRGVALSLGKTLPDGKLACAFHGWEFGAQGQCEHIPFNPDSHQARHNAVALPVSESGGLVWVFTGFDPDTRPRHHESLSDPSLLRQEHYEEWDCHWSRAMENMLDFPHLPYVHRTTIGRFVRAKQTRSSRLDLDITTTEDGFVLRTSLDKHPPGADLHWFRPNAMMLDAMPAPKLMRLNIWCVPVDENRTRMILVGLRNFATDPVSVAVMNRLNLVILHQDRAVVESSDPRVVPQPGLEQSVPTDAPTLTFRRWYFDHCADSSLDDPRRKQR